MEVQDKLRAVYDRLKSNPNISGLPDEYDKFKNAFLDKDKAKTIYERLKSEKTVSGLPDSFESFYSIVPSESIQNKIESDTAKSVENAQYGSNAAEKKGFWDSYMGDLLEKAGAGASAFGASVYSALEHFNNTVLKPWELPSASDGNLDLSDKPELQGVLDKMGVPENERRLTDERSWMKSEADNAYQYAETLRNRSDRYNGKSFRDLWKEGDYLGVVGDVFLQASESLPQSLVAMFGGAAGLALTGVSAGTQKYDELDKMPETKDLPEYQKVINAISTGAFEFLSELLGDIPIGNWIKGLYSKVGAREGEKVLKNGFQRFFDGLFKKYGVLFAPVAEGAEEVSSQIAENATDYFTGVSEELNLFDGVPESFVYGAGGGAQFSLGGIPGVIKRKHERRKVNKDFDTAREAVKESFPGGKADSFVDEIYSLPRVEQEEIITNLLNSQDLNDEQKNALVNLYSIMDLHKAYNTPEAITLEKVYGRFEKFRNNKSGDIVTARDSEGNPLYVLDETEKGSLVLKNDGTKVFIPSSELKDVKSESVDEHVNAFMANYLNAGRDLQSGETNAGMSMEGVNSEMAGENNDVSYNGYPVQVLESSVREDGTVLVEDANGETMRVPANELTDSNVAEPSSNSVQPADDSNMSPEENVVPAESMQPEIPLTKEGLPDYDSMPAEMFAEEFEKEFGAEETKAELEQMVTDVDAKIEKLRKKAPTDRNARAENKREILRLTKERENVLQALERYVPKQSAEEEIIGTVPEEMLMEEERLSTEQADEQVEDRQGTEEIKPVGEGFFGDIYDQFRGKAKEAVNFLMSRKEGEAIGALYHKDIGDIDLVWGNEKAGLMKIARKHPEMLEDLQSKLDAMDVVSSSDNRIILESPVDRAVVSKNVFDEKDKQWLLTAYEKKNANISGSSIDIEPEPEGKQNGTAPLQNESVSSETKVTGIPGEKQGEPEESAEQKILNLGKESVFLPYNKENRDEISEQISQGEYRAEAKEVGGMEETLSELKRRSKENEGDAQEAGGTLSGRQQKEIEARVAEAYAKEKGIWIPMQEIFSLGDPAPGGNENDVYFNSQDNSVYKVNNLMNSGNITSLLERIKLHNQYFPDTRYELVGFSGFGGRDIYPVLRQRYIENSTFATPEEIDRYMQSLGFEQTGEAEYSSGDVVISDLRPRNVLKDTDGDIYVVDAEFKKKESENSREDGESADGDAVLFREVENYTSEEDIEKVNRQFNERLRQLEADKEQKDRVLRLGRAGEFLRNGGIADAEIELEFDKFVKKSGKNYKNEHSFSASEIMDLPKAINAPITVFDSTNGKDKVILTELEKDGDNFIVAITAVKRKKKGGIVLEINEISTLYPKAARGIVNWINTGKAKNVDKKKTLHWLEALQNHLGTELTNEELSSATNIIENFENPKFNGDIRFRDVEDVNKRFNEELERYKTGQMRKNDMFHLGRPSGIISHFLPDLPIVMRQKIVTKGISKKHNVDIEAIKNMPSGISTPIFIFQRDIKTIGILSEMQDRDGKNICVAIEMNHAYQDGNRVLEVNSVNTFHGRDAVNIVEPIAHNNTLRWVDKEKGLDWISSAQLNGQEISNQDLSTATNIIENFENPIFPEREVLSEADKYTPEEQAVISRAQKEGTYMKAPNGKPSNLNEKQWAQVRTKAFKDWFGDWENDPKNASKVVDENGEPRVVFHGAPSIFNTFDTHRIGSNTGTADGWGFYFTTDKDHAEGFGTADGRVIEAFLNIRNPLDYSKKTISKLKLREIVKEIDRQEYANEGVHYFLSNYGDYTRGLSRVVDEAVNSEYEYSDNDVELVNSMIAGSGSVELIMNAVEKLTGKSSMIAPKSNGAVHYIVTSPNQIKSATDNSGEFSKENNDIRFREVDDRDVSSFAKKYGFDKEDVKKYAYGMQSGNLGGASYALKNIRRKARLDNDVSSLGEFVKLFSPIQNELFEKFGSVDVLREEQEKTHMDQVNMMEAARKRAEEEAAAERKRLDEFELMSDEQLDSEYFKALEANNEGRMRDLVNEAARRNGYVSSDEFRMAHRAPSYDEEGYDKSMIDVAKNKDDIRESLNEQFRMNRDRSRNESVIAIENALSAIDRGEEPTVTIYRAAPKSLKEGKVRNGDWVTLSKSYAKQHGNHALDGNYRIMKEEVPVENLYWDGNDMNEWGYDDRSDYRYRDVKNNRKLNDLITRDDSGNVIPLSERFNSRKNDPRFRQNESSGMSIAEVNRRFNEELEQQINGKLPKGHVYQLGRPGKELKSAGIPDLPIELVASRLSLKASEAYESDHPFELSEVKNLPEAIQNPIAVFDSKTRAGSKVIMTELTDTKGHHFVVAMNTNVPVNQYARRTLQINSIRSVYPKDNIRDIVNWINRGDLLKWSDKTKLGNWLTQQRSNSADVAMSVSELNVATNIIENFKNPTILEGEISSEIDQISGELGVKVNKVQSRKDLPDGIQRQMKNGRYPGLFDPKTGEVYMVMDEIIDVADAQATMLHEIVGHKGIRGLFGKKIGEFTNRVLDSMPENERQEWIKKYNGNEQLAAEEYVARFAEGYENPGVWEKIKAIFRELLHDFGIDLKLSDNDLKYILWRGVKSMQQDGTFIKTAEYIAKDRKMQQTLFREAQPDDEFADKHLSLGERAREAFQDRMLSVKLLLDEVKKRGGKVTDYANPYVAENLTTSKSKAQIDDFNKRLWQPLMNHIKEFTDKGKTREEVDHYMMAKHAPERNALLSERDGVENGSGITNEDAAKVVSEFEKDFSKERIDEFWDSVREATRFTIDTWQKHGLIDRTTKDYYDSMYQYYVPLRGWEESEADNIEYLDGLRRGSIVNVNKKAKGRSSLADSPLAYIANMAHSAIVAGNKNDVKRNVFEMMALNKNPDLYHLKKVYYVNTGTKESPVWVEQLEKPATELWNEGRVKVDVSRKNEAKRESYKTKQHQVEVFVNGQKYIMEFNGNMGVRVANAINGVNVIHSELLQNSMGRITRWMTANYTSKNPEFVVTNFLRDFGYAIPAYWMKGGKAGVLLKNMPKAFKAIHNDISGRKVDSDLQEMYEEFKINGGLTGYVHMTDIDSYKKWIERDIRRMSGDKTFGDVVLRNKAMRAGADLLEYLAQMSENSTRFAVYMSERQEGRSVTEAAYAAKEITTNFNRKGRCSSVLGSLYGFFNATVQGSANALGLAKQSPGKFGIYCGSLIALQLLSSSLCRMMGGEDETGENNYDRLADWVKYNNLVLPDIGHKGRFITIPLPHFFRALSSLGVIAGEVWNGAKMPDKGLEAMFDAVSGDLTPVEIATPQFKNLPSFLMSVTPTGLKPITEAYAFNRNFMNLPVSREAMGDQKKTLPQHRLAKKTTNPTLVGISRWLNEAGGGGEHTTAEITYDKDTGEVGRNEWKTWMDVNPAKFEHVVEGVFGGRLKFFNNLYKTVDNATKGEFEPSTTPVLRPLYQSPKGESAWIKFYEVRDEVIDIDAKASEFMKTRNYDAYGMVNYRNARLVETYKAYESIVKTLNDVLKTVSDPEQIAEIEKQKNEVVKEFAIEAKKLEKEYQKSKKKKELVK